MPIISLLLLALALAAYFLALGSRPGAELVLGLLSAWTAWPLAYFGALRVAGAGAMDLQRRGTLAWAALFPTLVLAVELFVTLIVPVSPWWHGALGGLLLAALTFALAARLWLLPLKPIFALRAALASPNARQAAAQSLARSFEQERRPLTALGRRRRAHRALAALAVLSEARCFAEARRVLDTLEVETLDAARRAALQAARATVLIYLGERNGAWSALKDAATHATAPQLLAVIGLSDALLSALDGHGREALERLESIELSGDPRLRRAHLIATSHALAATGDLAAARARLLELRELSPDGLGRVAELAGPASDLAAELEREE